MLQPNPVTSDTSRTDLGLEELLKEVDELLNKVGPIVAIVFGATGSGKSSVVRDAHAV